MKMAKRWMTRRSWSVLVVAVAVMTAAGAAAADPPEDSDDTVFNFGYDDVNHILVANTSPTDSPYDCTLENGTLTAGYGEDPGTGLLPIETLTDEFAVTVEFPNRPEEEVGPDHVPAETPIAYSGADGDCGASGVVVGGPQGQVNHGQVMVAFHKLIDKRGMGCINRVIAQSDLGKGDQQINTPDVVVSEDPILSGDIDFTTVLADCEHGNKHDGGNVNGLNQSQNASNGGRPDSPGKSGAAKGHNK